MKDCDCENCPLSWEDRNYEGDCDCGCMWYDDLYGYKLVCHLPLFAKHIIYRIKERQKDKHEAKLYDGIVEYHAELQRKGAAMMNALTEELFKSNYGERLYLCYMDSDDVFHRYGDGDAEHAVCELVALRYEELLAGLNDTVVTDSEK